jgi:hypothetical protein
MLYKTYNILFEDKALQKYYMIYKTAIQALIDKQIEKENIYNKSTYYNVINQYTYAFQFVVLIYLEYKRGLETSWSYYENKYDIETIDKKLQCSGIDIYKLFEIFGLPTTTEEPVQIEVDNIIEDVVTSSSTTSITEDIELPLEDECINNIEGECLLVCYTANNLATNVPGLLTTESSSSLLASKHLNLITINN